MLSRTQAPRFVSAEPFSFDISLPSCIHAQSFSPVAVLAFARQAIALERFPETVWKGKDHAGPISPQHDRDCRCIGHFDFYCFPAGFVRWRRWKRFYRYPADNYPFQPDYTVDLDANHLQLRACHRPVTGRNADDQCRDRRYGSSTRERADVSDIDGGKRRHAFCV